MSSSDSNQFSFQRAERLQGVGVSKIMQIVARASEMKRQGLPVIILGAGEPDFDTPDYVKQAAIEAMNSGDTKYTTIDGTLELKKAVQQKFIRDNNLNYQLDEITTGSGAKQILFNALMSTINPGDEVIIPTPYWTSYSDIVTVCGGVPVFVECSGQNGFRLQAKDLEKAITERTKWIMFNSPSNPTGVAYGMQHYRPLLDVLLQHPNIMIMADDIYEHVLYDNFAFATPAAIEPRLKDRTLTVNGVSKSYAMTGWRLGYGGGPAELIKAMAAMQSQSTSCPSSITQAATVAALNGSQDFLRERTASFCERRDRVVETLNTIKGIDCSKPDGAFYTFASCAGVLNRSTADGTLIQTDTDFCNLLLEREYVAVTPGSAFGLSPYFRISYATSMQELKEALNRIAAFVENLQ